MVGGALGTAFGAGMFAQYLKAEIQIWCLALLVIFWSFARDFERQSLEQTGSAEHRDKPHVRPGGTTIESARVRGKLARSVVEPRQL